MKKIDEERGERESEIFKDIEGGGQWTIVGEKEENIDRCGEIATHYGGKRSETGETVDSIPPRVFCLVRSF